MTRNEDVDLARWWPLPDAEVLRDQLLAAYGAPDRGYHDRRHLAEVLDRIAELAEAGEDFDPLAVRLAAWFHDAVYDGRPDDEERSAVWAERALTGLGVAPGLAGEVARLVRLTGHHRPGESDEEGAALSDADLGILASPPDRYAEYVEGVRLEHSSVPDEDFARGRAAVLRALAGKPTVFHTAYAREHWEPAARANLERELAALELGG